nr:hypothetical protein [Candidatus Kapabacteria bacterium]
DYILSIILTNQSRNKKAAAAKYRAALYEGVNHDYQALQYVLRGLQCKFPILTVPLTNTAS